MSSEQSLRIRASFVNDREALDIPLDVQCREWEAYAVTVTLPLQVQDRAQAAGMDVSLEIWPEMWHGWQSWTAHMPEAQEAIQRIGQYVRQKLDK